jgi:alginate O-acetyltransferase complex protein AlgI
VTPNEIAGLILAFVILATVYFTLPHRLRSPFLLAGSLLFYVELASLVQLLQLVFASALGYFVGLRLATQTSSRARKALVQLGVVLLVANLFFFKYALFLNENLRVLLKHSGLGIQLPHLQVLLPVGISFYTFQIIAYLVDVYRGSAAERSPGIFLLSVAFFPKLIAGPIERAAGLLPQLHNPASYDGISILEGTQQIIWGAFKKIVVADSLGIFVDRVYQDPASFDGAVVVVATFLYAFEIYFDFSGYADMAIGAARVLGFRLAANFNRPYCATSIQDFWKRWHITLSTWLTDYVYSPLLRQRLLRFKLYYMMLASILLTFFVSGLWHGARWNFILWGLLHGCYMASSVMLQAAWNNFSDRTGLTSRRRLDRALKICTTFVLVCAGYVFFRASSLADSFHIFRHVATGWTEIFASLAALFGADPWTFTSGALGTLAIMLQEAQPSAGWRAWMISVGCAATVLMTCALHGASREFIYYRF